MWKVLLVLCAVRVLTSEPITRKEFNRGQFKDFKIKSVNWRPFAMNKIVNGWRPFDVNKLGFGKKQNLQVSTKGLLLNRIRDKLRRTTTTTTTTSTTTAAPKDPIVQVEGDSIVAPQVVPDIVVSNIPTTEVDDPTSIFIDFLQLLHDRFDTLDQKFSEVNDQLSNNVEAIAAVLNAGLNRDPQVCPEVPVKDSEVQPLPEILNDESTELETTEVNTTESLDWDSQTESETTQDSFTESITDSPNITETSTVKSRQKSHQESQIFHVGSPKTSNRKLSLYKNSVY